MAATVWSRYTLRPGEFAAAGVPVCGRKCFKWTEECGESLTADHSARVARHIASRHGMGRAGLNPGKLKSCLQRGQYGCVLWSVALLYSGLFIGSWARIPSTRSHLLVYVQ